MPGTFSSCFTDQAVDRATLRERAYNYRWAEQSEDVIPLTAADPDFSLAPPIRKALESYLSLGSLAYGPALGLPRFREEVARDLCRGGVPAHSHQVLATDGAASAMFLVAKAILNPGDEAIIFDPVDFLFERSVCSAGAIPLRVPFSREDGLDLDRLGTLASRPKVKMIAICAPHNPYGRLLKSEEISHVAELASQYGLSILSDEVWGKITYDHPQPHSAAHPLAASRTFTVGGFSKSFGLAGLRIGFIHAPSQTAFQRLVEASTLNDTAFGASTLSQIAAISGLTECTEWFAAFIAHLKQARSLMYTRLNRLQGLSCEAPEATYLMSPEIIKQDWIKGLNSEQLCAAILEHAKVAVVPGSPRFFGAGAEGLIRLSFATSLGIIDEAMDRMESAWPKIRETLNQDSSVQPSSSAVKS